jgi:hypothetical protein
VIKNGDVCAGHGDSEKVEHAPTQTRILSHIRIHTVMRIPTSTHKDAHAYAYTPGESE